MGKLEDEVKSRIDLFYGGVPALAKEIKVPASSIYTVLRNGLIGGSLSTVLPILEGVGIDSNWITKNRIVELNADPSEFAETPLYGAIAAGTPIEMIEVEGTHPVPRKVADQHPDAFLLKVEGESMNRILPNGSYALVDPCEDVDRDGQPYAVCVNGHNATIKRVRKLNNGFQLVPDSNDPTYATETYNYNEPGTETITIIGRVVYYVLPFDWGF